MLRLSKHSLRVFALLVLASGGFTALVAAQGYASLKISSGARESAMGESGVAGASSANAMRWNPALMVQGPAVEVSLQHTRWLVGTSQSAFLVKRNLGRVSLGAEAVYFTGGEIELRDSIASAEPVGTYSFEDLSLGFGVAVEVVKATRVGLVLRYFNERLWHYSGSTWGFDAGLQYAPISDVAIGFSLMDMGFDTRLDAEGFKPPMTLRLGGVYSHAWTERFATALNADFLYRPYDKEPGLRTGIEAKLFNLLSLRAGAKLLYVDEEVELLSPTEFLTFGIGLEHKWISLDYALVPYEQLNLGLTHRITLNLAF